MFKTFELPSSTNIIFAYYVAQVDMPHLLWLNTKSCLFFFLEQIQSIPITI